MKPWHLGNTTVRSPFRLREGLVALSTSSLQGNLRGSAQDIAFRNLLGEHGIVALGSDNEQQASFTTTRPCVPGFLRITWARHLSNTLLMATELETKLLQLESVRNAIAAIEAHGQSYQIMDGGAQRMLTRANLRELYAREDRLEKQVARLMRGGVGVTYGVNCR